MQLKYRMSNRFIQSAMLFLKLPPLLRMSGLPAQHVLAVLTSHYDLSSPTAICRCACVALLLGIYDDSSTARRETSARRYATNVVNH